MLDVDEFTIEPVGPFSLREAATFGFGQRTGESFDGIMRLAFCVDGYRDHVGVVLSQDGAGVVHGQVQGSANLDAVQAQVARVLSLDHDGEAFLSVGQRDPVIARLLAVAPGLRPPLFHSPYEAAAWSVLSARRPAAQMMALRQRLSEEHGRRFDLAGQQLAAFPLPAQMQQVIQFPGLPDVKLERLHGAATAALDGRLDADTLRALPPEQASAQLQNLPGVGPFYSALILVRATGTRRSPADQRAAPAGSGRAALRPARTARRAVARGDRRALEAVPHMGVRADPSRRQTPALTRGVSTERTRDRLRVKNQPT